MLGKIRLGKTDMVVSGLGFGGIPIQRTSEAEAISVVSRCLELGIDFLDTANAYTTSEGRIGRAIAGRCREDLKIATKTMARDRREAARHLELSLERLGTGYIDLYQFHNVSDRESLKAVCDPHGPRAVLEDARKRGLIRHIGATSHSLDIAKELVKSGLFETIMFPLNFITNQATDELIPLARERNMGFIAMKPVEGGRITNVSLAFKYLAQFPDLLVLVGIQRPPEIEEISQICRGSLGLSEAERLEIERLRRELGEAFCRRCNYCQPCPQGIPIWLVLDFPSVMNRLPPETVFCDYGSENGLPSLADAMRRANDCTKCGACRERCPYGLPVPEIIEKYLGQFEAAKQGYLKE